MRVAAEVTIGANVEQRSEGRLNASCGATVSGITGVRFTAHLVNVSSHGCRLDFRGYLPEGAVIALKLDGIEALNGRVIWHRVGSAGIEFMRPLHPIIVQRLGGLDPRRP